MPHIKPKSLHPQRGTGYHASFLGIGDGAVTANDIVIATGYSGERIKFAKADANVILREAGVMGVADHTVADGGSLRVVSHKLITGVDTSTSGGAGQPIYLSDTAGGWSIAAGANAVIVGTVLTDHASTGSVLLAPAHVATRTPTWVSTKSAATSATTTLVAGDTGRTILMAANAAAVVLPAPIVGLTFKIIQTGVFDTAASTVKTPSVDGSVFFVGGYASGASDDGNLSDNNSNDVITFGNATVAGDYVELICITTTTWQVNGFSQSGHSSNGIAFSDS